MLPAEPTPDLASEPDWNEGPITEFSNAEEKPALVHSVLPEYPEGARKAGLQGKVFVKYLVHKDGSVSHPHVLKGPEAFRGAAKEAVRQFRFEPARQDGKPIPVWIVEPVVFRIH